MARPDLHVDRAAAIAALNEARARLSAAHRHAYAAFTLLSDARGAVWPETTQAAWDLAAAALEALSRVEHDLAAQHAAAAEARVQPRLTDRPTAHEAGSPS